MEMVYLNYTIDDYKLYCMVARKKENEYKTLVEFKRIVRMERERIYGKN